MGKRDGGRHHDKQRQRDRVYELPGGGELRVPASSLSRGANLRIGPAGNRVRRAAKQARKDFLRRAQSPVGLRLSGRLTGPVRLSFPLPARIETDGMALGETVQLAYYDGKHRRWRPVPAEVDKRREVVSVTIRPRKQKRSRGQVANLVRLPAPILTVPKLPRDWNLFTWDWDRTALRLDQVVGQLRNARRGPAVCGSGMPLPAWAEAGVDNGAGLPLRTCAEGQAGTAVVQIANNRPYSVILRYGAPVAWGWHQRDKDLAAVARSAIGDAAVAPTELYIPPVSVASVGVPVGSWGTAIFQASITNKSLAADLVGLLAEGADVAVRHTLAGKLVATCSSSIKPGVDGSPQITGDVLDAMASLAACFHGALPKLAASGDLDSLSVAKLENASSILAKLKSGLRVLKIAGLGADLADLYVGLQKDTQGSMSFSLRNRRSLSGETFVYQYDSAGHEEDGDLGFSDWAKATGRGVQVGVEIPGDLSAYRCVILDDNQSFSLVAQPFLSAYLRDGGTVVTIGEHEGFGDNESLNWMAGELGSHMRFIEDELDIGDTYTENIASSPLTAGVSEVGYNWASSLSVPAPSETLVASEDGRSALVAVERLQAGTLVLVSDSNIFTDNNNGFYDYSDNGVLARNLCG